MKVGSPEFIEEARKLGLNGWEYYQKLIREKKLPNPTNIHRELREETARKKGFKSIADQQKYFRDQRYASKMRYDRYIDRQEKERRNKTGIIFISKKMTIKTRRRRHVYTDFDILVTNHERYIEKQKEFKYYKDDIAVENDECQRCRGCGKHIFLSIYNYHHIIPRDLGGSDEDYNRIPLCYTCHDYVEIMTYRWIKSGKYYDIGILKSMIINDGLG